MNYYIQQSIVINNLKIESIANSSVLQIGTAGIIRGSSHLYNTGGFVEPAPEAEKPGQPQPAEQGDTLTMPSVPLVTRPT
ncbi:spore gernimation protein [Robertmurraya yapensis]|uniref:Spore gernimation protein n=1 Tax=Bacillus yapensis TaxID=2492960 RepID=A0A3S0IAY1_9BACI|nr:spore germination protein GerPB [Bacillus yapensis]RTR31488.1 spore gernimation protein [Bacillus yapensis]TKS95712.1 spore gernimation protein [Bacillus yapensis]